MKMVSRILRVAYAILAMVGFISLVILLHGAFDGEHFFVLVVGLSVVVALLLNAAMWTLLESSND